MTSTSHQPGHQSCEASGHVLTGAEHAPSPPRQYQRIREAKVTGTLPCTLACPQGRGRQRAVSIKTLETWQLDALWAALDPDPAGQNGTSDKDR